MAGEPGGHTEKKGIGFQAGLLNGENVIKWCAVSQTVPEKVLNV